MQSFMPLYEKYHDEGSPAIESIERVKDRAAQENRKYYFIVMDMGIVEATEWMIISNSFFQGMLIIG